MARERCICEGRLFRRMRAGTRSLWLDPRHNPGGRGHWRKTDGAQTDLGRSGRGGLPHCLHQFVGEKPAEGNTRRSGKNDRANGERHSGLFRARGNDRVCGGAGQDSFRGEYRDGRPSGIDAKFRASEGRGQHPKFPARRMTQVWRSRSYSLARKLTRMNLLVSCAALLTACAAFVAYDLATFRESVVHNLSVEAQIIGSNSVSALEFDDPHSAEKTLSALHASPNIISAGIYGPDGRVFAAYSRDRDAKAAPAFVALGNQTEAHSFRANEVLLTRSIVFGGKSAGSVRIRSDLESLYTRLRRFGLIVAAVLGASLISAFL